MATPWVSLVVVSRYVSKVRTYADVRVPTMFLVGAQHSEFSLSSPALQVLPMRPRIAFSGSPFPAYAASATRAVDSFPLEETPGAAALTK